MKFKTRLLNLSAGRPVIFMNKLKAEELNITVDDRLEISSKGKSVIASVDIISKIISSNEISPSDEIVDYLDLKQNQMVDLTIKTDPRSLFFIAKKLHGLELSKDEIFTIINDVVKNALTEAEIAYFVAGVYEKGMTVREIINLTDAIYKTGHKLSWSDRNIVDKHSIGGIPGNRTTPIVVSICAAAGLILPKTSSRAITSAAGTADVMETITRVDLSPDELKKTVGKTGACLVWGGTLGLAPADDKLIRIERLLNLDPESQLIASILAKKLAVGSKNILIDIPYGDEAKVSYKQAKKLGKKFIKVAEHFKLNIKIFLSNGAEPIGNGVGPILEMNDILSVLNQKDYPKDLERKSIMLAAEIFEMMGICSVKEGEIKAKEILSSGKALKKFNSIVDAQGRKNFSNKPGKFCRDIFSQRRGVVRSISSNIVNNLARILGCPSDKSAGIYLYKHSNDRVEKGEPICRLYAESKAKLKEGLLFMHNNYPFTIK